MGLFERVTLWPRRVSARGLWRPNFYLYPMAELLECMFTERGRMMSMASNDKPKKPTKSQRRTQKMKERFPDLDVSMLWSRKKHDGFATVPRTMPLVMKIIDAKSEKGHPAGHTLFCLWARALDHPYMEIDKPRILASEAGLTGDRAETSWRKRMATLVNLGFIVAKEGESGPYHYVVLLNPHYIVTRLNDRQQVQQQTWEFFRDRAEEVGALPEIMEELEMIKEAKEEAAEKEAIAKKSAAKKKASKASK